MPGGLDSQLGFAIETTPGVPVTPTTFVPMLGETLKQDKKRMESGALLQGRRVLPGDMWNGGPIDIMGDVNTELYNRGMGKLFRLMFGGAATTGAGPYTHTFTPATLTGLTGTFQVGRGGANGTVYPFTYSGCKVASWELSCAAGEIATLSLSLVGTNEIGYRTVADGVTTSGSTAITSATMSFRADDVGKPITGTGIPAATTIASVTSTTAAALSANATATGTGVTFNLGVPLATASYVTQRPVKFTYGSATIGGNTANIKSITLSGDNALSTDRRFLGSRYIQEPLEVGMRTYDGTMEFEFNNLNMYNIYLAESMAALVLNFVIPGTTDSITITANVRLDGETPVVSGAELLSQSAKFKCVTTSGGADSTALTVVIVNSDAVL
jgi:hypothetical protein